MPSVPNGRARATLWRAGAGPSVPSGSRRRRPTLPPATRRPTLTVYGDAPTSAPSYLGRCSYASGRWYVAAVGFANWMVRHSAVARRGSEVEIRRVHGEGRGGLHSTDANVDLVCASDLGGPRHGERGRGVRVWSNLQRQAARRVCARACVCSVRVSVLVCVNVLCCGCVCVCAWVRACVRACASVHADLWPACADGGACVRLRLSTLRVPLT